MKVLSGETEEINTKTPNQEKVYAGVWNSEDSVLKPLNQNLIGESSSNQYLRRNLSFSSAAICSHLDEESFGALTEQSRKFSSPDTGQHASQYPLQYNSSNTPDRYTRLERNNIRLNIIEKPASPSSFGLHQHSSESNSDSSTPIPLRCRRTSHSSLISSQCNVLDLFIDGEHDVKQGKNASRKCSSETGEDGKVAENNKIPIIGKPPRALCLASSSPHNSIDELRSYSFREISDKCYDHSSREWTNNDIKQVSQQRYLENNIERTSCAFLGKSSSGVPGSDSRINASFEALYQDSSGGNTTLDSVSSTAQDYFSDLIPNKKFDGHLLYETSDLQRKVPFSTKGHDTDEGLLQKLKELEEMYHLSCEENSVPEKLCHGILNSAQLLQDLSKVTDDRSFLATELSLQIRSRLAERSLANKCLKQSKLELKTQTRRLEQEKNELQLSLENELDRRTNEWSLKLSKFQAEEQRLRERVRELAEQNVSLQREISWFQGSELETKNSVLNIERQLNENRTSQEELKAENYNLHKALLDLQECYNRMEEERDHLRSSSKERGRENMELQKLVGRLQRTCIEQDKTISGLRQSYSSEIENKIVEKDNVIQLQTEKIRLTGVEQNLRREIDSCRIEAELLRNENIHLLNHLQETGNEYGFSMVRLKLELHAWVENLKVQSLSLLDDSSEFCGQLLDLNACKHFENFKDACSDTNEYSVVDLTHKYQNLTSAIGSFRRNLQILSTTFEEISSIQASKCMCQTTETDSSKYHKSCMSQDDMEVELKAEAILTRLLREKICFRELENEQLHGDLASSIRRCDLLRTDIQRLQDEVSCLKHMKSDMEIQMLKKDENVLLLQQDLQACSQDLAAARSMLTNVLKERDHIWEEMKNLRESNMLMDCEIKSFRKKIEILDEDVLYKEGQISILKDAAAKKSFDTICSPLNERI
ncbi:hypothetical protein KSP39_PZI018228 [Platanthera zijinensis]|uniref:DUF7653 domain-containing protein n=1 Tax=Platanthera zijinensis TaxID=2320716 RepID=A0AAP0FZA2_9ASPA